MKRSPIWAWPRQVPFLGPGPVPESVPKIGPDEKLLLLGLVKPGTRTALSIGLGKPWQCSFEGDIWQLWPLFLPQKARLFWRWVNWLKDRVEGGKQPVFLNLDETSISYSFHGAQGYFAKHLIKSRRAKTRIRKKELRGSVSHVAIIADKPDVQKCLPQVFIGNRHRFTLGLMAEVVGSKPEFIHLFRRKSSWNNIENMISVLELLAAALGHFPDLQPILLLDTVRCHIAPNILRKAAELKLWIAPVPAGLTYLLQPLDVRCFAQHKSFLRSAYRAARIASGALSARQWMTLLFQVCTDFLNATPWAPAFCSVGIGAGEPRLGTELRILFPDGCDSPGACLTAGEFMRILPEGSGLRPIEFARAVLCRRRLLHVR